MTNEERRPRPEHHVVHDYANLVSSWRLREPHHVAQLLTIPTANGHAWHAFQMNCRKMFEFFKYKPDGKGTYLRAAHFLNGELDYRFVHWTDSVQEFMNAHLLHVGMDRMDNEIPNDGKKDPLYFQDFQNAWQAMLKQLKPVHRDVFRDEIDFRLADREFKICGTLGKEFIL
ncbi:MAG: hypothetical protein ABI833_04575 [Acidobacteriota bacterium]